MEGKPNTHRLYLHVIAAIALGVVVGFLFPSFGAQLKPLGDGFIKLIKMLIAPIVFTTVVAGIAGMGDMRRVGRVGLKALLYFEGVTTLALGIGLGMAFLIRPGAGMKVDPATLDASAVATYASKAQHLDAVDFCLNVIPDSLVGAFAQGEILQVLLVAILFGIALAHLGERGQALKGLVDQVGAALFAMVGMIMRLAPIGAFGAMAFTIGKYGVASLASLGLLLTSVYATCLLFVFCVLGGICWLLGLSIFRLLAYFRDELLIVLGTSSSESVLPRLMIKLEALGCERSVVGLVIPTGYSFNLDGTSIYLTMAAIFLAQATGTPLSGWQLAELLGVLMLTSKGAAAVTGGGFITLAATLAALHTLPVASLALLLGIDRFMSEARALTNMVGNVVATLVVARWEGHLDLDQARAQLDGSAARAQA
ncbi:MAG: dcuC [Cyanobacteria bacterium RYN_339]|nr:dcuC [Cyanobacteria bacterium RYN_339]